MHPDVSTSAPPKDGTRQICCEMTTMLLQLVRSEGGEQAVAAVLKRAGSKHEPAYLENIDNWISLDEACDLFEAGVRETGDPTFARRVGERTVPKNAGTPVATMLRTLGSPEAVLEVVAQASSKFSTVTEMEAVETGPGRAVIRATAREGITRRRLHCDWAAGLIAGTPVLFGLAPGTVTESECQARGDAQCLYTMTWDADLAAAAADPQQRVTAMETQLTGMSERLHSVYAIASDLVSTDDLDTVLQRIVERAASAVRAPGYILAVRTTPDAEQQVYSHGLDKHEAQEILTRSEPGSESSDGASMLVVEITSSRRNYGQLIARYPDTVQFLPQEKEMLGLYAKHAAAVLDIATALQESAERHAQLSSLLSLAHSTAQAGTSEEVGERLAAGVPEVVDCDRIGVWRWDEESRCIRYLAGWGHPAELEARVRQLTISPDDTPRLRAMITDPHPQFFDMDTDDEFMNKLMSALGMAALVVVPIVAHEVFLGLLIVVVEDRPQRLEEDTELVDRLTGVAALAAPAIQNGLLVDELRHKASHDSLTGLLNRVGFRQHIDRALSTGGEREGAVGLLFVDLNDFKHVNDAHGHDFGDELLRQAAGRLAGIARGTDEVARLGGDEFAVILSDVRRDDQVRAAERRVRAAFSEPFLLGGLSISISASVGGGVWPADGDTVGELVRHADAAMYQDKAQGRRRASADVSPIGRRVLAAARAPQFGPLC
jgi:diguanylate cyclase (GGDEF)-like protein